MTAGTRLVPDCVASYAVRLHAAVGTGHHAASPLGAWLLLALAGPAARGKDRATLTEVLGCDVDAAAAAAAALLAEPHPLVAGAAAVWTQPWAPLPAGFARWREGLPAQVATGALPDQAGLDRWARDHTFGLVDHFPVEWTPNLYLLLATALATKVSWQVPFDLVPAVRLGPASPWSGTVDQVLSTPARAQPPAHLCFIAATAEAGDVAVHIAGAAGGLVVVSVIALPAVKAGQVLAAAYRIGSDYVSGREVPRRALSDLPLGDGPIWQLREEMASAERCGAVLPAWSARSDLDLDDPRLGFAAAVHALTESGDPWEAKQAVQAKYSRTGFEAAAVTGLGVFLLATPAAQRRRVAELRFGHPYAVVALTITVSEDTEGRAAAGRPWHGLPVFSAWVSEPEEA